ALAMSRASGHAGAIHRVDGREDDVESQLDEVDARDGDRGRTSKNDTAFEKPVDDVYQRDLRRRKIVHESAPKRYAGQGPLARTRSSSGYDAPNEGGRTTSPICRSLWFTAWCAAARGVSHSRSRTCSFSSSEPYSASLTSLAAAARSSSTIGRTGLPSRPERR